LARYQTPTIELELDEERVRAEVWFVAFANTSHYGGGMRIAPGADPADGLLDIVIVRRTGRLRLLTVFPRVYRGTHLGHPAVELRRVARVALRVKPPQRINADGEGLGETGEGALAVSVWRSALAVVRAGPMH
jgi:diacylglycerol kinase (ATP)